MISQFIIVFNYKEHIHELSRISDFFWKKNAKLDLLFLANLTYLPGKLKMPVFDNNLEKDEMQVGKLKISQLEVSMIQVLFQKHF